MTVMEEVSRRIQDLRVLDGDDDVIPSIESEGYLRSFIETNKTRKPEISVSPDGNFYAQWRESSDNKFSLVFFPDGKVVYVLFKPDELSRSGTSVWDGELPIQMNDLR